MAAMTTIMFVVCLTVGILILRICGKPKSTPVYLYEKLQKKVPLFAIILTLLIAEEVFARWLFLGVLGQVFTGPVAIFVLFLIGNSAWAFVHLWNYKDPADRHVLRVLPQFIGGIFLSVIFLAYGFFPALLVHIAYDMLIFSQHKRNRSHVRDLLIIGYNAIWLCLGLVSVHKDLTDLQEWTDLDEVFAISGWSFWNYFWAVVIVGALLSIVAELLLFDTEIPDEEMKLSHYALGSVIVVVLMVGLYWLTGFIASDVTIRLIFASMLMLFFIKSKSGSNLARVFWISIPGTIATFSAIFAVENFLQSVALMFVIVLPALPELYLRRFGAD
jgi:hypothetical protein